MNLFDRTRVLRSRPLLPRQMSGRMWVLCYRSPGRRDRLFGRRWVLTRSLFLEGVGDHLHPEWRFGRRLGLRKDLRKGLLGDWMSCRRLRALRRKLTWTFLQRQMLCL